MKLIQTFSKSLFILASGVLANSSQPPCNHIPVTTTEVDGNTQSLSGEESIAADTSFSIEAVWIGAPQWMGGVNNGYETFGGSIARGHNFFGSNLLPSQFVPVEIRFNSDSTQWSTVRVFKRYGYTSAGIGKFPGSAWDMTDSNNPRRLNLLTLECHTCAEPISGPPNFRWDPDTSANGKYEFLFVMLSDYDSTGLSYAGINILTSDPDVLYAWWPRVAAGHTFLETDSAVLRISPIIGLNLYPFETSIDLSWVYPGPDPDHFKLFYSTDSAADDFLTELDGTVRDFTHSGLVINQEYFYQIRAYDVNDSVIYSSRIKRTKTRETTISIDFYGQWDERNSYGGLWGYTDSVTGKEYALICSISEGLSIIDINTTPLVEVGFVSSSMFGVGTQEVRTYSHYAVVCRDGMQSGIIDLADVTNPQVIATIPGGEHTLQIYENYVFFAGGDSPTGVEVFDISNPISPESVSTYSPYYYHDYAIRNDTLAAFAIEGQGIDLLDISDIFNPAPIGHFNYQNSGSHNGVFSNDGRYLFVGDEIGQGNWTRVFDVSDPQDVSQVSDIIVDPFSVVHNCEIKGDHLYIAHYVDGLRIWNVSDPLEPYEVAFYDTYPIPNSGYNGAWGVYPHFASGKIIVSDRDYGLFVFESTLLGSSCCDGARGDINGDGQPTADLLDLTYLINDIYRGGPDAICKAEADLNGDGTWSTVHDLTYLINKMFRGGPDIPQCP